MELYGELYPRKSKNLFRVFLKGITQNAPFLLIFKPFYLKKKTCPCFLPSAKDRRILFAGTVIMYFKTKVKAKLNVLGWAFDDTINTLCEWSLPLSSNHPASYPGAFWRSSRATKILAPR